MPLVLECMTETSKNILKSSNQKEQTLIERAKKEDASAFREIVKSHKGHIAATVRGMLGNVPEAEDVGQEVFIRFFKSIHNFKGLSSLKTYLTRIAINLSLNELQKRKQQYKHFEKGTTADLKVSQKVVSNEQQNDVKQLINMALEYLDPKFRTVLVLRSIQGYSTKETAALMNIPLGTVLSRLNTGQKKLKEVIIKLNPDFLSY